jgi:hypothetical protein
MTPTGLQTSTAAAVRLDTQVLLNVAHLHITYYGLRRFALPYYGLLTSILERDLDFKLTSEPSSLPRRTSLDFA